MKKLSSGRLFLQATSFLSILLVVQPLYAQTSVESATRETDILSRQDKELEKLQEIPEKPPEPKVKMPVAKEGEEKFFIKKINLVGCEFIDCDEFRTIIEKFENKELTLSQLETLAKEIERDYLRRGIIAAVFIPQQEVKEQTVTLQVVEARMGELKIKDAKYFNNERLRYYWKVPSGTILRYDKISQSLQMMNKNPDREVKAALMAGKKPGTTDVQLTPKTNFPIHGTYSFDREGIVTSGRARVGYGMRHNNFLGIDDTFLSGYSFGRSFSGIYFYHTLPINFEGTNILYGYSRSQSKPLKDYVGTGLFSKAVTTTFSLRQDLYNKEEYIGEAHLGFDAKDKTVRLNAGPINRDRQRIINLGASFIQRSVGSTTSIAPEYAQGIAAFGANGHESPLASRGAYPVFSKFNLTFQHKRILPYRLQASLKVKGQFASRKLVPQEQYGLGGIDTVRGYPASDYLADNAVNTMTELLIPAYFIPEDWKLPYAPNTLKEDTTLVAFFDYGWGKRRGALTSEKATANLLSIGAGVRFSLFNQALLRMEWGFPIGANNPQTEGGHSKFHFSVDFQEKTPEEIERIRKLLEEENIKQWAWMLVNEELARPGSPIGEKLYGYLSLARENYDNGNLKESKMYYEKIEDISTSLYRQSEDYVRSCLQQEKTLKENNKIALTAYNAGKLEEAKQLWQKVIIDARPKPLILEF